MKKRILLILSIFTVLIISCTNSAPLSQPTNKKQCSQDSDCVPATCCHPKDAVNKAFAPDCTDMFCTQECAPGTIDCGQGDIKCVEKQCKALIY